MMNPFLSVLNDQLHKLQDAAAAPWKGKENLIGTMVDRFILRLPECGESVDDAVVVFLEALHEACGAGPLLGEMWKTMRERNIVDAWYYDPHERWRSVSFEFNFQRGIPSSELYLVVSVYVPMGVDDDPSHYPVEESTSYIRSSQTLHPVYSLSAQRSQSRSVGESDSEDESATFSTSTERSSRFTNSQSYANSSSRRLSSGWSEESSDSESNRPEPKSHTHTNSKRFSTADEYSWDSRQEQSSGSSSDQSSGSRNQTDWAQRSSSSWSDEERTELSAEVRFVAVGPDHTQVDRMFAAWRSDPGNATASAMIDLVRMSLPSLGQYIENGVAHRRVSARARSRAVGAAQPSDFWQEVDSLIGLYQPQAYGARSILSHHGNPEIIGAERISRLLESAKPSLQQFQEQRYLLPP